MHTNVYTKYSVSLRLTWESFQSTLFVLIPPAKWFFLTRWRCHSTLHTLSEESCCVAPCCTDPLSDSTQISKSLSFLLCRCKYPAVFTPLDNCDRGCPRLPRQDAAHLSLTLNWQLQWGVEPSTAFLLSTDKVRVMTVMADLLESFWNDNELKVSVERKTVRKTQ